MKAAYKIAADRYNSLMKNLNETSTTPRPADLPNKAPSFDQARLVACWGGKAPRVSSSDRWTSGYLIYLALLRIAGKNCGGSPSNVDHVVYDGGANIYHIAYKAPGLPKDAPSFDEARRLACKK